MSLPYEFSNDKVVVASGGDVHVFNAPSRQALTKLVVVKVGGGAFTIDVYNRLFVSAEHDVLAVENNGSDKCRILLGDMLDLKIDDPVLVAGNGVGGYNTTHRVTAVDVDGSGCQRITTDIAFTAVGTGGTAKLNIVTPETEMYRVLAQQTAAGGFVSYLNRLGPTFVNQDPMKHFGSTFQRRIYLAFSATGTYRVAMAFEAPESQG